MDHCIGHVGCGGSGVGGLKRKGVDGCQLLVVVRSQCQVELGATGQDMLHTSFSNPPLNDTK